MLKFEYQKVYLQNKKTLESIVDQQMMHSYYESYSSDECESECDIIQGDNLKLIYQNQNILLPKSLLELDSLEDFFEIQDFTNEELQTLILLLPESVNPQQLFSDLINGKSSFHFGSPLNQFLQKLKIGYFTKNREKCDKLENEISYNTFNEYYNNIHEYLLKDQNRVKHAIKRRNNYVANKRPYLLSSDDENDKGPYKQAQIEQQEIDEGYTTQSSQSQSPLLVQQVQIQPQPQFIPSAQSLFIINPIQQLAPLSSTSITTCQMTLALMQAKKQVKQQLKTNQIHESNVLNGQSNKEWLEYYWKQERERYANPLQPYTFQCIDGSKVTVGPVAKKLISGVTQKPRQHELLKNERPTYVTILSLVRDASARLPKGFGTRADIVNLVKDSQYINESLSEERMSSIISGALDRLHQSTDPCVKYDQEKKIWIYLHHDRDSTYPDWQVATPAKNNSNKKKNKNSSVGQINEFKEE